MGYLINGMEIEQKVESNIEIKIEILSREVLKEKISSDNYLNKNITNNANNQITEN